MNNRRWKSLGTLLEAGYYHVLLNTQEVLDKVFHIFGMVLMKWQVFELDLEGWIVY